MRTSALALALGALAVCCGAMTPVLAGERSSGPLKPGQEDWGYVDVREGAHMFWWVYATTGSTSPEEAPTVLWLQGGPGGSSTGFGNFLEIGPEDVTLQPRNTTWVQKANILFVDNPVGTGYSYVDNNTLLARDGKTIASDLIVLLDAFYAQHGELKGPFFVFCESFGGWMTSNLVHMILFGNVDPLAGDIADPTVRAALARLQGGALPLRGMALGDSWVSPIDYVDTWGPYLQATSMLTARDAAAVQSVVTQCDDAVKAGEWQKATDLWNTVEVVIGNHTDNVDWYNILMHNVDGDESLRRVPPRVAKYLTGEALGEGLGDALSTLMNNQIRAKLGDIPAGVVWGSQAGDVFEAMEGAFMQPMWSLVDDILDNGTISVTIYNGNLDLICCTPGTEKWMSRLTWSGMSDFYATPKQNLYPPTGPWAGTKNTQAFLVQPKDSPLEMYYILNAGHMVPAQNPDMALDMFSRVLSK